MQRLTVGLLGGCIALLSTAAIGADSGATKQIQMLNSQLQVQLQRMQETQQKQIQKLNKQLQKQLKDTQTKLQDQMAQMNTATQKQMKDMQKNLQAQIKQVHEELLTGGATAAPADDKKPAGEHAKKETKGGSESAPAGLQ
ncbi:MAG: hypothetical protein P1U32_02290 [Legionellaceae bacterium]|nr:hypothetical protein [Legionellaceae bacterium]